MALSKVQGHMLLGNLERDANLAISSTLNSGNLISFDIVNMRVGVNTDSPANLFQVNGNATFVNLSVTSVATFTSNANVKISGGTPGFALVTDGAGNLSWSTIVGNGNVSPGTATQLGFYQTSNAIISPTTANLTWVTNTTLNVTGNAATSTSTGALVVTGGTGISGNLYVGGISNFGNVGNVKITGGANGNVLITDGAGNLSWGASSGSGTPGGSNTQVQFNDAGSFGGNANFTYDKANIQLTINSIVQSYVVGNTQSITIAANNQILMGGQYEIVGTVDCTGEIHVL